MTSAKYRAAICGVEGNYGVVFPDFMGCVSAGETLDEASAMAHEALQLHVEGMVEDGEALPSPTDPSLDEVAASLDDEGDPVGEVWVAMIDVEVEIPDRIDTIPIRVKADLVQRIADLAEATARQIDSRQFIEAAVEHEIERYRKSAA